MPLLDREEYIEQAYFFRALGDRLRQNMSAQELLVALREELLSTTKLPLAVDFMASELRLHGVFAPAMAKLEHYFAPFQTYVVREAENERGRFDLGIALVILEREASYRAERPTPAGVFLYQFETLCRNRLGYDHGLEAIAKDPIFDAAWREWIEIVLRRQIGIIEFADLVYVRSELYVRQKSVETQSPYQPEKPVLFGEKEGRIALANRRKDPLFFFAALQRQLSYPAVPRPQVEPDTQALLPTLLRRLDRLETRIKLLEEEAKGGIDLSRFMTRQQGAGEEKGEKS